MTSEFYWVPAKPPDAKQLEVVSPGTFSLHMGRCFGGFPMELGKAQLERLEGMASTWSDLSISPYADLIMAIKKFGTIRVYMQQAGETE